MSNFDVLQIGVRRSGASWVADPAFIPAQADVDVRYQGEPPVIELDLEELEDAKEDVDGYGKLLSEYVFGHQGVKDIVQEATAATVAGGGVLRIRLFVDSSAGDLQAVRWELLRDPTTNAPLAVNEKTPFSRYLHSLDWRNATAGTSRMSRAIILIADPSDLVDFGPSDLEGGLAPVDVDGELERAERNLTGLKLVKLVSGASEPDQLPTSNNLLKAIRQGTDIVYLVCHGYHSNYGTQLLLEDDEGKVALLSGEALTARLDELRDLPRMVVLASCQSAGTGSTRDGGQIASIGPLLCEAGVPTVLAMQGNLTMDTAEAFLPSFFGNLMETGEVDRAMNVARALVREQGRLDWWVPIMFTRLKSGRLWLTVTGDGSFDKWPNLVGQILGGNCLPILGQSLTDGILGTRSELARRWARQFRYPMAAHYMEDLPHVAQYLRTHQSDWLLRTQLREYLTDEVIERYEANLPEEVKERRNLTELLAAAVELRRQAGFVEPYSILAGLPFRLFVTTDVTPLLTQALQAATIAAAEEPTNKEPVTELCRWSTDENIRWPESIFTEAPDFRPTVERPLVYHLLGSLDVRGSAVLTEDDYFDYLIAVQSDPKKLPGVVKSALAASQLLFLGFHIDDWDFRVILRSILSLEGRGAAKQHGRSVAVQIDPEEGRTLAPDRARDYLKEYFNEADINVYWGSSTDFLDELQRQYARHR